MNQKISLREVERNVFRIAFQDGLVDIFLGLLLASWAVAPTLATYLGDFWSSAVFLPVFGLAYLGLRTIRRRIVNPRLGQMKVGRWRAWRIKRFNIIMLVLFSASLALGMLSFVQFESISGLAISARFSLVILIAFSLSAYFLDFTRLYLYGLMTAAAPIIGELLWQNLGIPHHGLPLTFGVSAGVMTLIGFMLLVRLLRRLPANEAVPSSSEQFE